MVHWHERPSLETVEATIANNEGGLPLWLNDAIAGPMFTNASTSVAYGVVETCEKHPFLHFLTSHFLTFFVHSPPVMGRRTLPL